MCIRSDTHDTCVGLPPEQTGTESHVLEISVLSFGHNAFIGLYGLAISPAMAFRIYGFITLLKQNEAGAAEKWPTFLCRFIMNDFSGRWNGGTDYYTESFGWKYF